VINNPSGFFGCVYAKVHAFKFERQDAHQSTVVCQLDLLQNAGSYITHARAILQRFSQVGGGDGWAASQVGNRAGEFENAVVSAGGKLQLVHRCAHQAARGVIE
jgi:hypothetical protein